MRDEIVDGRALPTEQWRDIAMQPKPNVPHPEESYAKTNGVTRVLLKDQTCIELPLAQFEPIAQALASRANDVYVAVGRFGERHAIALNAVVNISAWTPEQLREMEADSALYTDHEERPWE